MGALKDAARIVRDARGWRPSHAAALVGQQVGRGRNAAAGYTDRDHLLAAAAWLGRAQDAMEDGGVAGRFSLEHGWSSSYPETSGYLVPTFLDLAKEPGLVAFEDRAARAIEFLLRLQLPEGGFPGGEVRENTTKPSVFNTAQIVCGLVAWHRHTRDQRAVDAAVRAGAWLVAQQDPDGAWSRHTYLGLPAAYSAHASCWLAELAAHVDSGTFRDAARRHLAWVLTAVDPETGWIDRAGFSAQQHADRVAFTHTIAYTIWGVLMTSELLGEPEGVAVARKASWAIARRLELERSLPGVLDHRWRRRATFSCVTGTAQMALIWMRQFEGERDARLVNAALLAIDSVERAQVMYGRNPGLRGGVPGSDPVWGDYIRLAYPNWAAKFFVDALLAKREMLRLVREREPRPWTPPDAIARSVERTTTTVNARQPRVVLYTTADSTKVSQMITAWRGWGFRPDAVVIESPRQAGALARLRVRVSELGMSGNLAAIRRRLSAGVAAPAAPGVTHMAAREVCQREGIPIVEVESVSAPAGVATVAALRPDIAVLAGAGILRAELLAVPRIGTLNAHMGVLPRYRGMNVAEWAALEGGPVGCSVHFVDRGVDTGPVLAARLVDVSNAHSIEELRALVDVRQIELLGEVLRALCERGIDAVRPYAQGAAEGRQFFRMHPELRRVLAAALASR
jgi:folate-dependent phosphoribosylglycinamide formyltransferase PurN